MNADVSISLCILADVILKTRSRVLHSTEINNQRLQFRGGLFSYTGHDTREPEMLSAPLTLITDFLCELREIIFLLPTLVYLSVKWL